MGPTYNEQSNAQNLLLVTELFNVVVNDTVLVVE